jgi:hypothetical protein
MSVPIAVIQSLDITPAMVVNTDVLETDHALWNAATAYAVGDRVIRTTADTHNIYERVVAGTTPTAPEADNGEGKNWLKVSKTNKFKLFDPWTIGQRTAKASSMFYEVNAGETISGAASVDMVDVDSVRYRLLSTIDDSLLWDGGTVDVSGDPLSSDWFAFWFGTWAAGRSDVATMAIPAYADAKLRVDYTGGPNLAVGKLLLGPVYEYGDGVHWNVRIGMEDYNENVKNEFAEWSIEDDMGWAERLAINMRVLNAEVDAFRDFLLTMRRRPAYYVFSTLYSSLQMYGRPTNFECVIPGPTASEYALDMIGSTKR